MVLRCNVMIVGVGGQGTLFAGRVLGNLAILSGMDIKVSEIHGMAQRGGSVVTHVKIGEEITSPIIEKGEADVILAFELLEGYRYREYLADDGVIIINDGRIDPMPVITGMAEYPSDIIEKMLKANTDVVFQNALEIARECGSIKVLNVVLLGMLARRLEVPTDVWHEALKRTAPPKVLEVNMKAFRAGYEV